MFKFDIKGLNMAYFLDVQMFRCSPIVCFILNIKHSWKLKQLNIVHVVAGSMLPITPNPE